MVSRKRGLQEFESNELPRESELLRQVRNMWEFASLSQWIHLFGRAVKIGEEVDTEYIESECLNPDSTALSDIGLAILKFVSSHRGLTHDIFDEYTRRQYVAKAPLQNPFGTDKEPTHFKELDIFTKIKVLQQLTQWTMVNPERIRERTIEQKDVEQIKWRTEQFGRDSEDRVYIVLADSRLYRRTEPKIQLSKPKKSSKKARAARRTSERIKASGLMEIKSTAVERENKDNKKKAQIDNGDQYETIWECMAINLEDYESFLSVIKKSRDPNEKMLFKRITNEVLPTLEKKLELKQRKQAQKESELLNLQKLACAKRSSRIASKMEQQKQLEELRSSERKRAAEIAMAQKEQKKWIRLEKERDSRIMTREQRLKEREARRILHEEELADLNLDKKRIENGEARLSERHLKAEIGRKKKMLEQLAEDDDWIFDCICGAYGQIDDGSHSIACDNCNTWQHSKCVGVSKTEADRTDFSFVCATCKRRADDSERAKSKLPITIKLSRHYLTKTPERLQLNIYHPTSPTLANSAEHDVPLHDIYLQELHKNQKKDDHTLLQPGESLNLKKSNYSPINDIDESSLNTDPISVISAHTNHKPDISESPSSKNPGQKADASPKKSYIKSYLDDPATSRTIDEKSINSSNGLQITQSHCTRNLTSQSPVKVDQTSLERDLVDFQLNSCDGKRQISSSKFSSLLTCVPTLSPCQLNNTDRNNATPSSTISTNLSGPQDIDLPEENKLSALYTGISISESHNAAVLPPAATGVSPIKNCHPRYVINNNQDEKCTSKLLPFTSLVPTTQILNHSSPVKPSESEKLDQLENK